jgi:flagellar protein FlaG
MTIQGTKAQSNAALPEEQAVRRASVAEDPAVAPKPVPPPEPRHVEVQDLSQVQQQIAARLQEFLRSSGRDLEFRVDDVAHATVITVRRSDTGEVVRQYPTEEALALLRRLNEQSGTFLDVTA